MVRPGDRLLVWFLILSFVFFVIAVIVEEFALFDAEEEVRRDGASGSILEQENAAADPASASDVARSDLPPLSSRQLRLISTKWPPFTDAPGKPRFALDLADAALERVGIVAQMIVMDEDRLSSALLNGGFDGSAAAWKDDARDSAMVYSQPYLENRLILVGRPGSDVSPTSLAGLAGRSVALVAGSGYEALVEQTEGPAFVRSNSEEESVRRLLGGEVDYLLMDDLVSQYLIGNHGEQARTRLAFGSTPLLNRSLHLAIRRSLPDADTIISRFNAEARAMIADRTYHRLLVLGWIKADVDGDGHGEYVPFADRTGPDPPAHFYELFASGGSPEDAAMTRRYFLGGSVYENWSAVPESYKTGNFGRPEPMRDAAGTFSFTWQVPAYNAR